MYYEEKVIDGKLMYRHYPQSQFQELPYNILLSRYLEMKQQLVTKVT